MFQTKKNKKKRQEEKFAKYNIKRQSFRHKYEKITKTEMEKITKRSSWCDSKEFFRKKEEKRKEKIQQNEEELMDKEFNEEFAFKEKEGDIPYTRQKGEFDPQN